MKIFIKRKKLETTSKASHYQNSVSVHIINIPIDFLDFLVVAKLILVMIAIIKMKRDMKRSWPRL